MTTLIATVKYDQDAMALYAEYEILYYQHPVVSIDYLNCMASILLMPKDVLEKRFMDQIDYPHSFLHYLRDQIQILYESKV